MSDKEAVDSLKNLVKWSIMKYPESLRAYLKFFGNLTKITMLINFLHLLLLHNANNN